MRPVKSTAVGAKINNFEVLATGGTFSGNRVLEVMCLSCLSTRQAWATNLHSGKVKCLVCNQVHEKDKGLEMARFKPYALVSAQGIQIYWQQLPPTPEPGQTIYRATGREYFEAISESGAKAVYVPGPDSRYPLYIVVPNEYMPYYLGEKCSDELSAKALEYYNQRVKSPPDDYSEVSAGVTRPWVLDGAEWAYLYLTDNKSTLIPQSED